MKKIYLFLSLYLLSLTIFQSCEYDYGDLNIDPSRPSEVELNLMLPEAIAQSAYNQSANPARISAVIMQQFSGFDATNINYDNYFLSEELFDNYWRTGLYAGVLKSCQAIIEKASSEGNAHYEGMAKVLMAHNYGAATSYFGDIPMSEALQGANNPQPAYDTQQLVYESIQTILDDAISLLESDSGPSSPSNDDLLFGGDPSGWIAYAKGLKARFAVHTSNRTADWNQIATWANEGLAATGSFNYGSAATNNNPLAKFGKERPNTLVINDQFADTMTEKDDPRQSIYMEYNGNQWIYYRGSSSNLKWAQDDAVIPVLSDVELKFILAEAAYHTGGNVQEALNDAIVASMNLNDVDGLSYIVTHGDISNLSGDAILERIIEEAYIAYYGIAFSESWMNYRRTGYPSLTPNVNGSNNLNPSGIIPRRFLYPVSESQTNSVALEAAKTNQGGALLDNTLWAF